MFLQQTENPVRKCHGLLTPLEGVLSPEPVTLAQGTAGEWSVVRSHPLAKLRIDVPELVEWWKQITGDKAC